MKAIENDGYYYDPPSWKVCDECHNGHFPYPASDDGDVGWCRCPTCGGTGLLPIRYTPEEWKAAKGILTDDTPVWVLTNRWVMTTIKITKKSYLWKSNPIMIATSAGPPEEER